jgi:hypothetical protein
MTSRRVEIVSLHERALQTPSLTSGSVYNIIMDFVLATFPWILTWNLDMRRAEKVGLCITMSLVSPTTIFLEELLTDCSPGNDCRYRLGSAHRLEGRGQRKR